MIEILGYDIGETTALIAMEMCKSNLQSLLDSFIKKKQMIEDWPLIRIYNHLIQGMAFLHAQNIIHRDIKPDNVLIQLKPKVKTAFSFDRIEEMIFKVKLKK